MSVSADADHRPRPPRLLGLAAWLLLTASAHAQTTAGPELHVAFAGSAHRGATPALAWLCEQYLPGLPAWPVDLDARGTFSLTLTATGLTIGRTTVTLPSDAVAIGTCRLDSGAPDASAMVWRCDTDGVEQWHVPNDFVMPQRWHGLLHAFEGDVLDTPRTLAVAVMAGHLAGGMLDGDARSVALRLGASMCGEATWLAWRTQDHIRVRGRSEGGLMLPLVLLAIAAADGSGSPNALSLRAFAARDADRAEAARQLGRDDREVDLDTLRALLRAEDSVRLTAIDALVRQGASEELPNIVAAADPTMPWATIAATDALHSLWPDASPRARQATRAALHRSQSVELRGIDVDRLPQQGQLPSDAGDAEPDGGGRARLLMVLLCSTIGLLGLWTRERVRLRPAAA